MIPGPFAKTGTGNLWNRDGRSATQEGTPGVMTNNVVRYSKIARPFPTPETNMLERTQVMQFLIGLRDQEFPKANSLIGEDYYGSSSVGVAGYRPRETHSPITGMPGRRYTLMGIPTWNWLSLQQYMKRPPMHADEVLSMLQVWNRWALEGPVISETGANAMSETYAPSVRSQERVINLNLAGPQVVFNLWGPNVLPQTKLWLICKGVDYGTLKSYRLQPDSALAGSAVRDPSKQAGFHSQYNSADGATRVPKPPQLVAYAKAGQESVPLEELQYLDEFGYVRLGVPIEVGRVLFVPPTVYGSSVERGTRSTIDIQSMLSSTQITILYAPKHC
jgi:hypothetical protein